VFADKGFDRATVEHVARAAEFSVGALYTFFKNKDVLWSEVIAKIGEDFLAKCRAEIGASRGSMQAIVSLIELRLRYAQEHGPFLRVVMDATPASYLSPAAAIPRSLYSLYDAYIEAVAGVFAAAMREGLLRKTDATYAALSLEGVINTFRAYWARRGIAVSLAEQARLVQRHVLVPLSIRKGRKKG
jgi:AcrR family transcriptional regulator